MRNQNQDLWNADKRYSTPTLEICIIPQCVLSASNPKPTDGWADDGYEF